MPRSITDTFNRNYQVAFYQRDDPSQTIVAWLGDTPPTPSAGGGGYNVITLPFRSAVSVWQGRSGLLVQDIPIMLYAEQPEPADVVFSPPGHGTGAVLTLGAAPPPGGLIPASTAQQAAALIRMWRPDDDTEAPPVIKVNAPSNVVPYTSLPWWVSDFTWGAAIGDDTGTRIMQQLTIQVTEYRADEQLQTQRSKHPTRAKRNRHYVVHAGDTLVGIARRYHLRNGWRQLAAAQNPPINDPRQLRVGQRLVIPGQ